MQRPRLLDVIAIESDLGLEVQRLEEPRFQFDALVQVLDSFVDFVELVISVTALVMIAGFLGMELDELIEGDQGELHPIHVKEHIT